MSKTTKFVAAGDFHYGWEWKNGKLVPIHNQRAIDAHLEFVADYKPDHYYLMGDGLDCSEISHWNQNKKKSLEGRRLIESAQEMRKRLLSRVEQYVPGKKKYPRGNHEMWLDQFVEINPGVEGLVDLDHLLNLKANGWEIYPQGHIIKLGKWHGIHGDSLSSADFFTKPALIDHEKSLRIWHTHTYQVYTKKNAIDASEVKNAFGVPGMCNRDPNYGRRAANRYCWGFNWGEVDLATGFFTDHVTVVTKKGFWLNGKHYGK